MDQLDAELLYNAASLIMQDEQGNQQLVAAAKNSPDPAIGVAQYVMMLMQAISDMLEKAGVSPNPEAWLAEEGAVDMLLDDVAELLRRAGIDVGPDFEDRVMPALLERVKGAAQAESANEQPQAASPSANAGGLLGMV